MSEEKQTRVVLAEDDEPTRFWLKLTLQNAKVFDVVAVAGDGQTAVDLAREHEPDLLLMDIGMPVMDGVEASRKIKEFLPNSKIIMFTSHDTDDSVFAALSAGADGYCLKTLSAEQLLKAVSSVLDGAAWLDPGIARKVLKAASQAVMESDKDSQAGKSSEPVNTFALSARELEVLALLVDGLSNQEIADKLCLGTETIKTHMRHIMRKLSVSDRTQAAIKAMRQGIV